MKISIYFFLVALGAVFTFGPTTLAQSPLVSIETVTIGDPGNSGDFHGSLGYIGSVNYTFNIGTYEVTIAQYSTFLNSVASVTSSSYLTSLWNVGMASNSFTGSSISRSGSGTLDDPFSYSAIGSANRPIGNVSWFDAARFANWMNNGATNGASTETGAYTLNGLSSGNAVSRNSGAVWWIPSEDEWFKSAYYKGGGTNTGYWLYPTASDTAPTAEANPPGAANSANYNAVRQNGNNQLTDVGSYNSSPSAYGTYDQGGNIYEMMDSTPGRSGSETGAVYFRGGFWNPGAFAMESWYRSGGLNHATREEADTGFRLATAATNPQPTPSPIAWQSVNNITGESDVSTLGTLLYAYNIGENGQSTPPAVTSTTVNGVSFSAFAFPENYTTNNVTIGDLTITEDPSQLWAWNELGYNSGAIAGLSAGYQSLLGSGGSAGAPGTMTIKLGGLTLGQDYLVQWWSNDSAMLSGGSVFSQTSAIGNPSNVTLDSNTSNTVGALGQYVIGTFTAISPFASFDLNGIGGYPLINAIQVRNITSAAVPEPGQVAASLLLLGGIAGYVWMKRRKQAKTKSAAI